jgi:hypothetical protein
MTFFAQIRSGILLITNRKAFTAAVSKLKDGSYELTLKKRNRRSLEQNAYYWGCVIADINDRLKQLGNDFSPDEVHEFLKERFNAKMIAGEGGEVLGQVGGSTTEMNKEEFGIYLDKIIQWAAEFLQITIQSPGEQTEMYL